MAVVCTRWPGLSPTERYARFATWTLPALYVSIIPTILWVMSVLDGPAVNFLAAVGVMAGLQWYAAVVWTYVRLKGDARFRGTVVQTDAAWRQALRTGLVLSTVSALIVAVLKPQSLAALLARPDQSALIGHCVSIGVIVACLALMVRKPKALFGPRHALPPGPLRDRLFAVSEQFGVPLREIWVLEVPGAYVFAIWCAPGEIGLYSGSVELLRGDDTEVLLAYSLASPNRLTKFAGRFGVFFGIAFAITLVVMRGYALPYTVPVALGCIVLLNAFMEKHARHRLDTKVHQWLADPHRQYTAVARMNLLALNPQRTPQSTIPAIVAKSLGRIQKGLGISDADAATWKAEALEQVTSTV